MSDKVLCFPSYTPETLLSILKERAMTIVIEKDNIQQYRGFEAEPTKWFTVTQDQINQFAECTLDRQFIHVDPDNAKKTQFGTTIAHGFLSLSMLSFFSQEYSVVINGIYMGVNYGFDRVRFIAPVKVNSRIRAHAKVLEITEKDPGQYILKTDVTIEIEGEDKPALKVEWITLQMIA